MSRIKSLLFLLALVAQVPLASATVTYAVGSCKPSLPSFPTIMGALGATPRPNVVEVCAGSYPEQVVITFPVTLEGIAANNSAQAMIVPPANGIVANATNDFGQSMAAQVFVENAGGEVNLTNLTVRGWYGFPTSGILFVGVFYQNSPGTMNHLTAFGQYWNGLGYAVWLEGGSANPSVTLENSSVDTVDNSVVVAETNTPTPELTVTIKGNFIAPALNGDLYGIDLSGGVTASVSGNLIWGGGSFKGILINGGEGSVTKNTVVNVPLGIDLETNGVSVTSNTIYNTLGGYGIGIVATSGVAPVTDNKITLSPIAIDLNCTAGDNVHSNTILDATLALIDVPTGILSRNTYYNVGGIGSGGC